MKTSLPAHKRHYHTIVIGAGAAGLYFTARSARSARACRQGRAGQPPVAAAAPGADLTAATCPSAPAADSTAATCPSASDILILEKTSNPGTKLLMSGGGQCNLTHAGDIKEFLLRYGQKGRRIRTCLFQHNNLKVCNFFEELGVRLYTREDGKIFPASMDARQVRDALLQAARDGGVTIRTSAAVIAITDLSAGRKTQAACPRFMVTTADGTEYTCNNLVVATGGRSYPSTGSDGNLFTVLARDLGIPIAMPRPALTPVYVEDYPFSSLSGISLTVQLKIFADRKGRPSVGSSVSPAHTPPGLTSATSPIAPLDSDACFTGDLLLTHKNFSGPVILNNSRYMKNGTRVEINFLFPYTISSSIHQMKKEFPGNTKTIENWMATNYSLPKRFCEVLCRRAGYVGQKVSTLSGDDMKILAQTFCAYDCIVSGLGGFREAMVTAGGVLLDAISPRTMESKDHPGLYFIGEVLDVDGDTGGYNLQFAFASAAAASSHICSLPNLQTKDKNNKRKRYSE